MIANWYSHRQIDNQWECCGDYSITLYVFINARKKKQQTSKIIQSELKVSFNWGGKYEYLCVIYIESLEHVISWKAVPTKMVWILIIYLWQTLHLKQSCGELASCYSFPGSTKILLLIRNYPLAFTFWISHANCNLYSTFHTKLWNSSLSKQLPQQILLASVATLNSVKASKICNTQNFSLTCKNCKTSKPIGTL